MTYCLDFPGLEKLHRMPRPLHLFRATGKRWNGGFGERTTLRMGLGVLRIRTAHSTRVVGGSTSGTTGSSGFEISVTCVGAEAKTSSVWLGGGSEKSRKGD